MASRHQISECLSDIGIAEKSADEVFGACSNLEEEFSVLKKAYHRKILQVHPDKGGDGAAFLKTRAAFEVLRGLFQKDLVKGGTFGSYLVGGLGAADLAEEYDSFAENVGNSKVPSHEHYAEAAEELVPGYRVELAKSGRSRCVKCVNSKTPSANIKKNALRVGSMDKVGGTYTRWHHLECWRVPRSIWSGLTDPEDPAIVFQDLLHMDGIQLSGVAGLVDFPELKEELIDHIRNQNNWANPGRSSGIDTARKNKHAASARKEDKRTNAETPVVTPSNKRAKTETEDVASSTTAAMVASKPTFAVARSGTEDRSLLKGKRFVLTGVFPEVGGGTGLNLGKDKVQSIIESFGGKVTASISGKTDYLIVGKEPGYSKVSKARSTGLIQLDMRSLHKILHGDLRIEAAQDQPPPQIESFSAGYNNARIGWY